MTRLLIYTLLLNFFSIYCLAQTSNIEKEKKLRPPLMGWASWNNYRININDSIIKTQTDALIKNNLARYGYNYINIDDGFFGGRNSNGKILVHKKRFPNGMKYIADYIHSKGLKAGIYSDAGINTCASYYDKDTLGVGMGLYGHDKQDLTTYLNEWGFDFIKVDWCGGEKLGLDEEIRYTEIGNLISTIKPTAGYNVCRWEFPGKWVIKIADSWRISTDLNKKFNSILKTIDQNADLWRYSSYGHYNDMDMLQIGRGMTYEEDKAQFSMWSLMHSPLILGNDLNKLSEQTKEIITNEELIAINQSQYVYQARRLVDYGELEVWGRPLISTMSGQIVVVLLNRTNEIQTISFNLETVGINPVKCYNIKDLWTKESSNSLCDNSISKQVPAHGVLVLKITGESIPYNIYQNINK